MTPLMIGIIAVMALAAVALIIIGQRRTRELHQQFGPEYDRTVKSIKDRGRAEAELRKRAERVERLHIRPLAAEHRAHFEQSWQADQARFVDDPRGAVREADRLIADLMQFRGYPVADFAQRAADVSVDHPRVVDRYRMAHDIADRDLRGEATTEHLRNAMVHYRALFSDLLIGDATAPRADVPVTSPPPQLADAPPATATPSPEAFARENPPSRYLP
jgi:hypothetical protein